MNYVKCLVSLAILIYSATSMLADEIADSLRFLSDHYMEYDSDDPVGPPVVKTFRRADWDKQYNALDNFALAKISELLPFEPTRRRAGMIRVAMRLIAERQFSDEDKAKITSAMEKTLTLDGANPKVLALIFLRQSENFSNQDLILPLFADKDASVRLNAAELLQKIGTAEILPKFEEMLRMLEAKNAILKPEFDGSVIVAKQAIAAIKARASQGPIATISRVPEGKIIDVNPGAASPAPIQKSFASFSKLSVLEIVALLVVLAVTAYFFSKRKR